MDTYALKFAQIIAKQTGVDTEKLYQAIERPPEINLGDFALPCFILAKEMQKSPVQIAQELAEKVSANAEFSKIEAKGPYLNAYLNRSQVIEELIKLPSFEAKNIKTVLEYPSPNTNKPLHLGHLRNMLLGQSISRIKQAAGENIVQVNLYNDRGVHICKSMVAYQEEGEGKKPEDMNMRGDEFVGHWYVEFAKLAAEDENYNEKAQAMLREWEAGNPDVRQLWKQMNQWCYQGHDHTYKRLDIEHQKRYYESDIYNQGAEKLLEAEKKGKLTRDENGNLVADLGKNGEKIVLRADGTSIYITQDVELAHRKHSDFNADKYYSIVGDEQRLHFLQLAQLLEILEFPKAKDVEAILYGMIRLPSGKMKSREGTVVDAEELIDEVKQLAKQAIVQRHAELPEKELNERAEKLAQSAIRYYLLKYEPRTGFVFDPQESLEFEGETGPYIQYGTARINSLLETINAEGEADFSKTTTDEEWQLITSLAETKKAVDEAAQKLHPHIVARHAMKLAQNFTTLYHTKIFKEAPQGEKEALLAISTATKKHLEYLLELLGIAQITEM